MYVRLSAYTRWFKYDRDWLCVNKSQFVPVIFEPPCISVAPTVRIAVTFGMWRKSRFGYSWPTRSATLHEADTRQSTAIRAGRSRVRLSVGSLRFFIDLIPPGCTVALSSTQPLTEMSTRGIPLEDKGGRFIGLTILPLSCADWLKILGALAS
jgi:hypothetical protein